MNNEVPILLGFSVTMEIKKIANKSKYIVDRRLFIYYRKSSTHLVHSRVLQVILMYKFITLIFYHIMGRVIMINNNIKIIFYFLYII